MENPILIHLHSRMGTYKVKSYNSTIMNLYTHDYSFTVPVSDFKCLAGGKNNAWVSEKRLDEFQSTVSSEYVKAKEKQKLEAEAIKAAIKELKEQMKKGEIDLGPLSQDQILKAKELDQHLESLTEENLEKDDFYDYDEGPDDLGQTAQEQFEALQKEVDDLYKENRKLTFNLNKAAQKIYNQPIDFSDYQNLEGIKFIIQVNNEGYFRFR